MEFHKGLVHVAYIFKYIFLFSPLLEKMMQIDWYCLTWNYQIANFRPCVLLKGTRKKPSWKSKKSTPTIPRSPEQPYYSLSAFFLCSLKCTNLKPPPLHNFRPIVEKSIIILTLHSVSAGRSHDPDRKDGLWITYSRDDLQPTYT